MDGILLGTLIEETATRAVIDAPEGMYVQVEAFYNSTWHPICQSVVECPLGTPTPTKRPTRTPTPANTPTPTPTLAQSQAWLTYLNTFRNLANLPPLTENPDWSMGEVLHSRYMVKNDFLGHTEDPANPWYTPEGNIAAQNGNVFVSASAAATYIHALNAWMSGPFHQVAILDPKLETTSFGLYQEADGVWQTGATLDVLRGRTPYTPDVEYPILYPADGQTVTLGQYAGGEFPDPLSACPGYTAPTGSPIVLQLDTVPGVTTYAFQRNGTSLEACVFDETSYTNSDPVTQQSARGMLAARHAVVLLPRQPLTAGTYTVAITTNGTTYTWSFTQAGTTAMPETTTLIQPPN
jgi:uncharacterized protein YkwD